MNQLYDLALTPTHAGILVWHLQQNPDNAISSRETVELA